MNGWQRLWLVVSIVWLALAVGLGTLMLPAVYVPPTLVNWSLKCDAIDAAERLRNRGEQQSDIAAVTQSASDNRINLEFYVPDGKNGKEAKLSCNDVQLAYNPNTKRKQLAVFGTIDDPLYGTFHAGFDLDDAVAKDTRERLDTNREYRRNTVAIAATIALVPPVLLYVFGAAVAWIRRGFSRVQP